MRTVNLQMKFRKLSGKISKYKDLCGLYVINFSMLLLFFGGMLRKSYNADTVFHMVIDDADVWCRLLAGRYITALGDYLLLKAGIRTTTNISITIFFAFIFFAAAMSVLQNIFQKWVPEHLEGKIGFYVGVNLVFLNILAVEMLMFSECSIYFAIAYLLAATAVKFYTKKKYACMLLALALSVCTYQYAVVFAAIVIAFYICMNEKWSLKAIWHECIAVVVCMGLGVLNLLSINVLKAAGIFEELDKNAGIGNIEKKIEKTLESLCELYKDSANLLPSLWIPLLFTVITLGVILWRCCSEKKYQTLLFTAIVWMGSHILLYVIPFVSESFYFPPRMSFCFYLIQGLLVILAFSICGIREQKFMTIVCIGYLGVQLLFSNFIVTNHFVSNTLDEVYTKMVYEEILEYEEASGIKVEKLAVCKDTYAPDYYEEVAYHTEQINERVLGTSTSSLMYVVTGRMFKLEYMDQNVSEKYFGGKNWDCLDMDEQLVFEGDTLYWCIF